MKKFSPSCWLIVALLSWLLGAWGCSPEGQRELSLPEKVQHARSVFLGQVIGIYPDPRFDYGVGSEVYLAEMAVSCVYKTPAGLQVPALVNVTDVGSVPGHCHQSALYMDRKYIVLTINEHHKIMGEEIPSTEEHLDVVLKVCGLHLQNPAGSNAASDCRQPANEATCTTVVDYGPNHDHNHPEDHDHDHDGVSDHTADNHHSHSDSDEHSSSSEEDHDNDHDHDHDHDHDEDGQPDHTHAEHPHDHDHGHLEDHDHDHDGEPDHTDSEHPWDHDHSHSEDHDHDHDGKPDHTDENHPLDHDHSHNVGHDHDHDGKPDHDSSFHDNAVTPDSAAVVGENSGSETIGVSLVLLLLFGFIWSYHNLN